MIQFPNIFGGISLNINPVAFQIGNISVFWYGIIIAVGFLAAVLLAMGAAKKYDLISDNVIDLVLISTPIAIVFARIYYVIFSWDNYNGDFFKIINIREGGIAIYGAVLGGFLGVYIFSKWRKIESLKVLDFVVPYLALGQGIGRWGNFVNQEAFGTNTDLPWGMMSQKTAQYLSDNKELLAAQGLLVDPNLPVHPTFLYESILCLAIFAFLIFFRDRKKLNGEVFCMYMMLYGFGRTIIESMRTDSLMIGTLKASMVLAILFALAFAAILIARRVLQIQREDKEVVEVGNSVYGDVLKKMTIEDQEAAVVDLVEEHFEADTQIHINDVLEKREIDNQEAKG